LYVGERGMSGMMYAMTLGFDEAGRGNGSNPPVTPFSMNRPFSLPASKGGAAAMPTPDIVMPPVDIRIGRDEILLVAEMPGVKGENIDIRVLPKYIEITGTPHEWDDATEDYQVLEAALPGSKRSRRYTGAAPPKGARARFRDGVLELRLPRRLVLPGRHMSRIPVR